MLRSVFAMACMAACLSSAASAQSPDASALRGVIRAVNEAAISSDIATRIVRLPFREGDSFKHNDVLVEFDCDRLKAELKAADADRRGQLASWENSARLYQMRAAGAHDVSLAAAAHDKAAAIVEGLESRVRQCQIFAPFDGRVVDLHIRRHETPSPNQPLIRIIDERTLEVDLLLPASVLASVRPGIPFRLKLDDTGVEVNGEIMRVGGALDIVSQTFKASGRLNEIPPQAIPGVSGSVSFTKNPS